MSRIATGSAPISLWGKTAPIRTARPSCGPPSSSRPVGHPTARPGGAGVPARWQRATGRALGGRRPGRRAAHRPSARAADRHRLRAGGEAGARLPGRLGMPVSADTLLRLIRRNPDAAAPTPTVLGVDDWASHKGLTYGTI